MKSSASASLLVKREVQAAPRASLIPSRSPAVSPSEKAKLRETLIATRRGLRSSSTLLSAFHCSAPTSSACRASAPASTAAIARRAS